MSGQSVRKPGAAEPPAGLDAGLRRDIFLRSLALQASWHPQRMQNLGLLHSVVPWLRRSRPTPAVARRFCRRHYGFFNTNPFLVNFLLGGLIRLEEENLRSGGGLEKTAANFKTSMGRALASLGDQFFWRGLQPAVLMLTAIGVLAGLGWMSLVPVLINAILMTVLRWRALGAGYDLGLDIVALLDRPTWHRAINFTKRLGTFAGGFCLGLYVIRAWRGGIPLDGVKPLVGLVLAFSFGCLLRRRLPGELVFLLLAPLALALTRI